MNHITVAIVDDSAEDRAHLISLLSQSQDQIGVTFDIREYSFGNTFLESYTPDIDIVFMDIDMPDIDGLKAASFLREKAPDVILIFATNYAYFALKGYDVSANDFIVKPISAGMLYMKLRRLIGHVRQRKDTIIKVNTTDGRIVVLSSDNIFYIEVADHSITFHTSEGNFSQRMSLSQIEDQLPSQSFVRCNNCYLVNLKHVFSVHGEDVCVHNEWIRISRPKKKAFLSALADYLGGNIQ